MTVSGGSGERWGTGSEAAPELQAWNPGETRAHVAMSAKSLPRIHELGWELRRLVLLHSRGAIFLTSGLCALGLTALPHGNLHT